MADYSDETLRALIRQLITEDVPTDAINPRAQRPDERKALGVVIATSAIRKLFSLKGIVGLTAMGLIFEPTFTKDLLGFGLDQFKDLTKAIKAFNDKDGSIFEKLAAASDYMKDSTRKNKYLYLHDLKEHVSDGGGSLPGNFVYKAMTSYKRYKPSARQIAKGEITPGDVEIYNAIATNDFSGVYDSAQFETGKNDIPISIKGFNHTRSYEKPSIIPGQSTIGNEYNDLIKDAELQGQYLNASLIEAIRDAHEHTTYGEIDSAKEAYGKAKTVYRIAESGSAEEIDKITMFENIEDIEKNFGNGFITTIKNKAASTSDTYFKDLVSNATDIVTEKLGF